MLPKKKKKKMGQETENPMWNDVINLNEFF